MISRPYRLLLLLTLLAYWPPTTALAGNSGSNKLSIDLPVHVWLEDYLAWTRHSPAAVRHDGSTSAPQPVMLGMPYLELFSPNGASLYRGSNAAQNAVFLQSLQHGIPTRSTVNQDEVRPTLQQYLEMVSELKPYASRVLNGKEFTLFAVTYPDRPFCKPQNDAMQQLESRPDIRVLEIRLHS